MSKVYVACPWHDRDLAKEAAKKLEKAGHTISHPWWDYDNCDHVGSDYHKQCAQDDLEAVMESDVLFLMNLQERGKETSGKAVETGLALAMNHIHGKGFIKIFMQGPKTNVFHCLDDFKYVNGVEEIIECLKE